MNPAPTKDALALVDRLQTAMATLAEVHDLADGLPEHAEDVMEMHLHLSLASTHLAELALTLLKGEDIYDAVLIAARGTTPIS